jgi:hypothetical protein
MTASASFDVQYLDLLRRIQSHGIHRTSNKKGANMTLLGEHLFVISVNLQPKGKGNKYEEESKGKEPQQQLEEQLSNSKDDNIVPLSTLRYM